MFSRGISGHAMLHGSHCAVQLMSIGVRREKGRCLRSCTARAAKQFLDLINEPLLWLRVVGAEARAPGPAERKKVAREAVSVVLSAYARRPK